MIGQPTAKDASLLRRMAASAARNLGWMLASRGVLAILSLVYLGIVTRTLGVEGFGRFALITTAAQALATMVGFQTWQIVVQFGVGHIAAGDDAKLARLLRACGLLDIASAVLGVVLGAAILLIWHDAFGIKPGLMRDTMIFLIVSLVTIRSMPLGILRLTDRFDRAAIADSVTPVMRFVGAFFVAFVVPTVKGFLYAWMVAELATAIVYWTLAWRDPALRAAWFERAPARTILAENPGISNFAASTNISSTLGLASKQVPLLIVGAAVGTGAAGGFRLAAQIAQALAKLSQLLTRAAFPEIVRAMREASSALVLTMLGRMFVASTAAGLVILAALALIGDDLLVAVGGPEYAGAYTILLWLALAGCLDLAFVGFEPVLMAMNRAGTTLIVRAAAVVAMAIAAVPLIERYGAVGAAMAVFAGSLVGGALQAVASFAAVRRQALQPAE